MMSWVHADEAVSLSSCRARLAVGMLPLSADCRNSLCDGVDRCIVMGTASVCLCHAACGA